MRCVFVAAAALIGPLASADQPAKTDEPTAGQQPNDRRDLDLTARIRRAIVKDHNLSLAAHNVTIVTQGGVVTLKGDVRSLVEKSAVASKAIQLAGASNVRDELTVAK